VTCLRHLTDKTKLVHWHLLNLVQFGTYSWVDRAPYYRPSSDCSTNLVLRQGLRQSFRCCKVVFSAVYMCPQRVNRRIFGTRALLVHPKRLLQHHVMTFCHTVTIWHCNHFFGFLYTVIRLLWIDSSAYIVCRKITFSYKILMRNYVIIFNR